MMFTFLLLLAAAGFGYWKYTQLLARVVEMDKLLSATMDKVETTGGGTGSPEIAGGGTGND